MDKFVARDLFVQPDRSQIFENSAFKSVLRIPLDSLDVRRT